MAMSETICPSCGKPLKQAGYTERCAACDGAWIHEDALVGMLQERASTMVSLPWQDRTAEDKQRNCAVCSKPMQRVNLGSVALDRCAEHGVWFDSHELAALLAEAKTFKAHEEHEHRGLLHTFAKLFGG
jgi:Zn-finger nucleic acid-binding protein